MFEKAYPQKAEKINKFAEGYNSDNFSGNKELAKYILYKDSITSKKFTDDDYKIISSYADKFSSGMFTRYCEALKDFEELGNAGSVDEFIKSYSVGSKNFYHHGSTAIYDVESHKNSDGSVDFTFSLANKTLRSTEITLYNADGDVIRREYMKGQRDPSSVPEMFKEFWNMCKDVPELKMFSADSNSFNSKERYTMKIPAGGYIQITDDPDDMNYDSYSNFTFANNSATDIGIAADLIKFKTGNSFIDSGLDIGKGAASRVAGDAIQGSSSSFDDYAGDAAWTVTEAIATAGEANPAAAGMAVINGVMKVNTAAEEFLVDYQQNKARGNNSLYIYN